MTATTKRWIIIGVVALVAVSVVVAIWLASASPGTGYKLTGSYPPASASQVVRQGADTVSNAVVRAAIDATGRG